MRHRNWKHFAHIAFGLLSFASFSLSDDSQYCTEVKDEQICYLRTSAQTLNWVEAGKACDNINATLPVIHDFDENSNLEKYLTESKFDISNIWLSARWVRFQNWTWINGKKFQGKLMSPLYGGEKNTHAALKNYAWKWSGHIIFGEYPFYGYRYLCQNGGQCKIGTGVQLSNSCLIPSNMSANWYDARVDCELKGGNLAILMGDDYKIVENITTQSSEYISFWMGLRKGSWFWKHAIPKSRVPDEGEENGEVKYLNFNEDPPYPTRLTDNFCISSRRSGLWEPSWCEENYSVICQRREPKHRLANETSVSELEINKNTRIFAVTITTAVVLLFIAIGVTIWLIIRRKTPASTVTPSSDKQYQDMQRTHDVHSGRERSGHYEEIESEDNGYQELETSEINTDINIPDHYDEIDSQLEEAID